jgi:hypothetical protein
MDDVHVAGVVLLEKPVRIKEKAMRMFLTIFMLLLCMNFSASAAERASAIAEKNSSSVSATQSINFLGRTFELKFKSTDRPVRSYEFYQKDESPDSWLELVEFQIYPMGQEGSAPIEFAKQVAAGFIQRYPDMQYAIYNSDSTDVVMLDFFYPTSTRKEEGKEFLEFNAFKFFLPAGEKQMIGFHYAKNIESISESRSFEIVSGDIKRTREELVSAMSALKIYSY